MQGLPPGFPPNRYTFRLMIGSQFLQAGLWSSGRSSAWLERLVWDQEVACSNHVAPTYESSLETRGFRRFWAEGWAGGKPLTQFRDNSCAPGVFGPSLQHARRGTVPAPLVAPVHRRRSEGPSTTLSTGECRSAERVDLHPLNEITFGA